VSERFEFEEVQAFTSGALGQPGRRTFFIQARSRGISSTPKCEKQQVDGLAGYLARLLDDLPDPDDVVHPSQLELAEPVLADWVLGSIGVAYDGDNDRVVLLFEEVQVADEDEDAPAAVSEPGMLRLRLTRGQARSFCDLANRLVASGRPPCRFCNRPLDPPRLRTHELMEPLELLANATLDIEGRMPWSSNATFLCNLVIDGDTLGQTIYKPHRGERPLWDFPSGLYQREVAAYRLCAWLGWGGVPPTIMRDGPFGIGSAQLFIPSQFEEHYFTLHEKREDLYPQMRAMAAFDLLANNTDRKSGHCLLGLDGNLWAIDNGLCFAAEFKLRTVIWDFAGEPLPAELLPAITALAETVPLDVATLLADEEIEALRRRAAALIDDPVFPADPTGRRYPWPLV
jgi:uncharacterized repeat protein (TIGR03843 family)